MILDDIVMQTYKRLEMQKQKISLEEMKSLADNCPIYYDFPFEKAMRKQEMNYILEVKKASPSKGIIDQDFDYMSIAKEYESIGADAISVLTEPHFFYGSPDYLKEIKKAVHIPILRKDFIIDEYMIYEAKVIGADAILLICSILTQDQLTKFMKIAYSLGLSVLVETHDAMEIQRALNAKAKMIGVNNRHLQDFTVDLNTSINLRKLIPNDIIFISESGIHTHADIQSLTKQHVNAILIGEALMTSQHKQKTFDILRGYHEN